MTRVSCALLHLALFTCVGIYICFGENSEHIIPTHYETQEPMTGTMYGTAPWPGRHSARLYVHSLLRTHTRLTSLISRLVLHAFHPFAEGMVRTQHADAYLSWLEYTPYVRLMFDAPGCRYNLSSSKAGSQDRSQQVVSRVFEYLTFVLDIRKACSQESYLRRMAIQTHDHHHFPKSIGKNTIQDKVNELHSPRDYIRHTLLPRCLYSLISDVHHYRFAHA